MFFSFFFSREGTGPDQTVKRNKNKVPKAKYNCGGYALGTFNWYIPYRANKRPDFIRAGKADYKICVETMLEDFSNLRVIKKLEDADKNEVIIAFRLDGRDDFHYVRKGKNGSWYHKMGNAPNIDRMTEKQVFTTAWAGRYDKPIVLFAMKEE